MHCLVVDALKVAVDRNRADVGDANALQRCDFDAIPFVAFTTLPHALQAVASGAQLAARCAPLEAKAWYFNLRFKS